MAEKVLIPYSFSKAVEQSQYVPESKKRAANNDMDKDAFLKVLVAQMTNQDPMSPMEDTQFIAQMAQFSALEQSMQANNTSIAARAEGMIGKEIIANAVVDSSGTMRPADVYGKVIGSMKVNGEVFLQLEKGYMVPVNKVIAVYDKIPEDLIKPEDPTKPEEKPEEKPEDPTETPKP